MQINETRFITTTKTLPLDSSKISIVIYGSRPIDRMKSHGHKSLLPITKTQNIIDIQLEAIRTIFPRSEVVIIGGFEISQLIRHRPHLTKIIENYNFYDTNDIEDIRIALNAITNNKIITISSDVIMNSQSLLQLRDRGSCVLVDYKNQFSNEDVGATWTDTKLEMLSFGIPNKWCHIAQFCEKELELLKKFALSRGKNSMMLYEGINFVITHGGKMSVAQQSTGYCRKIERVEDLNASYSKASH